MRARFVAVDQPGVADSLREPIAGRVVSVGDYRTRVPLPASAPVRFFHNPYVNRIWPIVELYDYRTVGGRR